MDRSPVLCAWGENSNEIAIAQARPLQISLVRHEGRGTVRRADIRSAWKGLAVAMIALGLANAGAEAQRKENRGQRAVSAEVTFSIDVDMENSIRAFYEDSPESGVEALPPGIRRNLARGKPLPPGIAKRSAPPELVSSLPLPQGYELVEVGLDVFLVEVATTIVHDILMDVVR